MKICSDIDCPSCTAKLVEHNNRNITRTPDPKLTEAMALIGELTEGVRQYISGAPRWDLINKAYKFMGGCK
jgi:hypothetical protein